MRVGRRHAGDSLSGEEVELQEIETRPGKPAVAAANQPRPRPPAATQMPNHPWRRSYQDLQALGSPKRGVAEGIRYLQRDISIARRMGTFLKTVDKTRLGVASGATPGVDYVLPGSGGGNQNLTVPRTSSTTLTVGAGFLRFGQSFQSYVGGTATVSAGGGTVVVCANPIGTVSLVPVTGMVVVGGGVTITATATSPACPTGSVVVATAMATAGTWDVGGVINPAISISSDPISFASGFTESLISNVRSIAADSFVLGFQAGTNTWSGVNAFTGRTRVPVASGAPVGLCDATTVGAVQSRSDVVADGPLYVCGQSGAGTYTWVRLTIGGTAGSNDVIASAPEMGVDGGSGISTGSAIGTGGPTLSVSAIATSSFFVRVSLRAAIASGVSVAYRLYTGTEGGVTPHSWNVSIGCWPDGTSTGTAAASLTMSTPVSMSFTGGTSYRRSLSQSTTLTTPTSCAAGDALVIKHTKGETTAGTDHYILSARVSW